MGKWNVDTKKSPGILHLQLAGQMTSDDMREFLKAHNKAIDSFAGHDYRVFCDIRELLPMKPDCAAFMEEAKKYSSTHRNFKGSAVLVASALGAMQHQRTSVSSGVIKSELISESEEACREHLLRVNRAS